MAFHSTLCIIDCGDGVVCIGRVFSSGGGRGDSYTP